MSISALLCGVLLMATAVKSAAVDRTVEDVDALDGLHVKQLRTIDAMYLGPTMRILAGGSGFGGKSHVERRCHLDYAATLAMLGIRDVPTLMTSRDNPSLKSRMIMKWHKEFGHLGEIRPNHGVFGHCFLWHAKELAPILFRNLVSGKGMEGNKGMEVGMSTIDELTECSRDHFGSVAYVTRHPSAPWRPVVCGSNPDGVGHAWVKALWRPEKHVAGDGWGWEAETSARWKPLDSRADPRGKTDPRHYIYIPYLPEDNPNFDEEEFWMNLIDKPLHIQQARRYGLWTAPENARFDYLDPERTLFEPTKKWPSGIPQDAYKMVCVDWGLRHPYCALWVLRDSENDWWVYREDYKTRVPTEGQIQRIRDLTGANETISRFVGDPAFFHKEEDHHGRELPRAADIYQDGIKGDKRFQGGFLKGAGGHKVLKFATLDKLLGYDNGYPNLRISADCVNLWGELTSAVYKTGTELQNLSEEIDERNMDHAIDALVYGFHAWLPLERVVETETPEMAAERAVEERRKAVEKRFYKKARRIGR